MILSRAVGLDLQGVAEEELNLRPSSYETYVVRPTGFYDRVCLLDLAVYLGKYSGAHADQGNGL